MRERKVIVAGREKGSVLYQVDASLSSIIAGRLEGPSPKIHSHLTVPPDGFRGSPFGRPGMTEDD
jgi:hypothetical protein